jgi:hypothetical protein
MIAGSINIEHVDYSMLESVDFTEYTETREAGGFWKTIGVATPDFPLKSDVVHQTFDSGCPGWAHEIKQQFTWLLYSMVTINKLAPGCFIPPHTDTLYRIQQKALNNTIDVSNLVPVRINLFLQNKEMGHMFEMDNTYLNKYNKGDYVIITTEKVHSVANLGYLNRYTMQLTGFIHKDTII